MTLTQEQLKIASKIDARVRELERAGANAVEIFMGMSDLMAGFKQLMETAKQDGMDELAAQFGGFYRYAKILENIALGIESGEIKVPK